ncbi:response regulator, partial [Microcoleus sp. HI-ES]|nr:response regulator [Microcoleus sp. HI-ES]
MSASSSQVPTILAVDDSVVMQGLVKQALSKEFRVLVTDNAVDALSTIYH